MSTTPTYRSEPGSPPLEQASPPSPESSALSRLPGLARLDTLFSNGDEESGYLTRKAPAGRALVSSVAKFLPSWNPLPEDERPTSHKLSNESSYPEGPSPSHHYSTSYPGPTMWYHDRVTFILVIVAGLIWATVLWTYVLHDLLAPMLVNGAEWRITGSSLENGNNVPWAVVDDVMGVAGVCEGNDCQWVPVL